ncbi:hypothetical protein [Desulfosporosinus sp.]|nr:hypothetical protein [Desulfosporosinus sp.]
MNAFGGMNEMNCTFTKAPGAARLLATLTHLNLWEIPDVNHGAS